MIHIHVKIQEASLLQIKNPEKQSFWVQVQNVFSNAVKELQQQRLGMTSND